MSTLSSRQTEELNRSILDYLAASNLTTSFESLKHELDLDDYTYDPKSKVAGLLEKKWTSVIRLQKKIMDLESRNAQLLEEVSHARANPSSVDGSGSSARSSPDWIPRAPAKHTLTGHRAPITSVCFHPVFAALVTASEDSTLKIWDWESGEYEQTLKGHTKAVTDCDYDSKGNFLVSSSSDLTIKMWSVNDDYKNTKTFFGHDHSVSSVRFMPSDTQIVSASRDKSIRLWDVSNGFCVKTLNGHAEWVRCVQPSIDGRWLASCSSDQSARVWDAVSGETKVDLRGHDNVIEAVAFAPAASYAAIRELAGIVAPSKTAPSPPTSSFLATGGRDKLIKLWDGVSGQCLRTLSGHDNWVRALAFHPNGQHLISASDDKTIRVWDLKSGRCAKTIDAHSHFVTCLSWGRQLIKSATQAPPSSGEGLTNGSSSVNSPNGGARAADEASMRPINVIATGSVDQSVKIWMP